MEKKIVEFALDFERKGTVLYLELASKVKNPLGKNLFYALAKQEIDHAKRIEEFNTAGEGHVYLAGYEKTNSIEEELKSFFKRVKESSVKDNLDAYETAMQLEKESYGAYERFLKEAEDASERKLLEFLLSEEKNHMEAIANVYSYLSETSDWLERDESRTWNWMNA